MILSAYTKERVRREGGYLTPDLRPREVSPGEFDFFVRLAAKSGGPVLELASGAGRILMVLAEAGFEVVGIEASEHMLALGQKAIAQIPMDAQKRIHLVCGDMRQFAFRRKFPLVIIPYYSFWYNFKELTIHNPYGEHGIYKPGTYDQAEQCLCSITEALDQDGVFAIDTPEMRFESAWWDGMAERHGFSYRIETPYQGWAIYKEVLVGEKR